MASSRAEERLYMTQMLEEAIQIDLDTPETPFFYIELPDGRVFVFNEQSAYEQSKSESTFYYPLTALKQYDTSDQRPDLVFIRPHWHNYRIVPAKERDTFGGIAVRLGQSSISLTTCSFGANMQKTGVLKKTKSSYSTTSHHLKQYCEGSITTIKPNDDTKITTRQVISRWEHRSAPSITVSRHLTFAGQYTVTAKLDDSDTRLTCDTDNPNVLTCKLGQFDWQTGEWIADGDLGKITNYPKRRNQWVVKMNQK